MEEGHLVQRNGGAGGSLLVRCKYLGVKWDLKLHSEVAGLQCIGPYFKKLNYMAKYS